MDELGNILDEEFDGSDDDLEDIIYLFYKHYDCVFYGVESCEKEEHVDGVPEMCRIAFFGKNISICNTDLFMKFYSYSTQMDICMMGDGLIEIDFTYYYESNGGE